MAVTKKPTALEGVWRIDIDAGRFEGSLWVGQDGYERAETFSQQWGGARFEEFLWENSLYAKFPDAPCLFSASQRELTLDVEELVMVSSTSMSMCTIEDGPMGTHRDLGRYISTRLQISNQTDTNLESLESYLQTFPYLIYAFSPPHVHVTLRWTIEAQKKVSRTRFYHLNRHLIRDHLDLQRHFPGVY